MNVKLKAVLVTVLIIVAVVGSLILVGLYADPDILGYVIIGIFILGIATFLITLLYSEILKYFKRQRND